MTPAEIALHTLAVRVLDYVGFDPNPDPKVAAMLDGDAEMRAIAKDSLCILKLRPRAEHNRFQSAKRRKAREIGERRLTLSK